jgi:hypothetical protein
MIDDWGWLDTADEPRYTAEEILRVADWLVQQGHAESGYAERLRLVLKTDRISP